MRNLIVTYIFSLLFMGCKKEEPTLAETVMGIYTLNSVNLNKQAAAGVTGSITLKVESELKVGATVKLTFQGKTESADITGLDLTADGADIDLSQDGSLVGTVTGKSIVLYFEDEGDTWEFNGTK